MRDFLRRVGLPSIIDATPATLRPPVHMTPAARLLLLVGRPLWAWRVELATVLLAVAVLRWLAGHLGIVLAVLLVAVVALAMALVPEVRRSVLLLYRRAHVRRQWTLAVRHAGLANFNDRVPRVVGHRLTLAGDDLAVRVPAGKTVTEVEDKAETIAAFLRVREVRVHRRPEDAGLAQVMVVVRDPLGTTERWPWPNVGADRLSLWQPIPVGLDEDGELVTLSLVERNILYGGEPGSGKSVAQSLGTATAALDPDVKLHLFDGKYVELAPWAGCAEHMIGPNQDEAIDVLKELVADMDGRYMQLLANKRRKLRPEDGLALHVVEIDELAFFCNGPDRAANKAFTELARDLVGRGRAAGYIVKAATQKPSGDTIPTYLRDLFAVRWAFRCSTSDASDTILGKGWAKAGYSADTIDVAHRGVGYLLHEGGRPVRLRTFYLADLDLYALAAHAELLRADAHRDQALEEGGADTHLHVTE